MEQGETNEGGAHNNGFRSTAEEKMHELSEKAKFQAESRVRELSDKARQRAGSYASLAQQRLDGERDHVASTIEDAASQLRSRADAAGPVGHAAGEQVAHRMEAAAVYLHSHEAQEIAGDIETYVRQHPIQSVVAAAIFGYICGRILS